MSTVTRENFSPVRDALPVHRANFPLADPTIGPYLQWAGTVLDDSEADVLTGSAGIDWFFLNRDEDKATDPKDEIFANDTQWPLMHE